MSKMKFPKPCKAKRDLFERIQITCPFQKYREVEKILFDNGWSNIACLPTGMQRVCLVVAQKKIRKI